MSGSQPEPGLTNLKTDTMYRIIKGTKEIITAAVAEWFYNEEDLYKRVFTKSQAEKFVSR